MSYSSANLKISGSTTDFPIVAATLRVSGAGGLGRSGPFQSMPNEGGVVADVEQGGSDIGIADCINGKNDIGMTSRPLTSSEASQLNSYSLF